MKYTSRIGEDMRKNDSGHKNILENNEMPMCDFFPSHFQVSEIKINTSKCDFISKKQNNRQKNDENRPILEHMLHQSFYGGVTNVRNERTTSFVLFDM